MTNYRRKGWLLVVLLLGGCIPITPTSVVSTESFTISPTALLTMIPTRHLIPTATELPSEHLTMTPVASLTIPPTLSLTEIAPTEYAYLSVDSLRTVLAIDLQCQPVCWLGITPDVTSVEDAYRLLKTSREISKLTRSQTVIKAYFRDDLPVSLRLEKDKVKSIDFDGLGSYQLSLNYFIQFFGEPDEIRIGIFSSLHCASPAYFLYFQSRKVILEIGNGAWNGPDPNDIVFTMTLNSAFDEDALKARLFQFNPQFIPTEFSDRQPWLGYGYLQEYLPGKSLPSNTCGPLPTSRP